MRVGSTPKRRLSAAVAGPGMAAFAQERGWGALGRVQGDAVQHFSESLDLEPFSVVCG
jgi:hypothetical protein